MGSRRARIFLLAFMMVWFGAIVPGHQRRVVVLGSASNPDARADAAHCAKPAPSCHAPKHCKTDDQPTEQETPVKQGTCAVCHFASTIELATAPDVVPRPTETSLLKDWATPSSATIIPTPCFDARGPPA